VGKLTAEIYKTTFFVVLRTGASSASFINTFKLGSRLNNLEYIRFLPNISKQFPEPGCHYNDTSSETLSVAKQIATESDRRLCLAGGLKACKEASASD
jgi:hypothetical protein